MTQPSLWDALPRTNCGVAAGPHDIARGICVALAVVGLDVGFYYVVVVAWRWLLR